MNNQKGVIILPLILIILVIGVLAYLVFQNVQVKKTQLSLNQPTPTTDTYLRKDSFNDDYPKPKYSSNYTVTEIDTDWSLLVSEDFNISINIPKDSDIHEGGGFDKYYPEMETAQLGFTPPLKLANITVTIDIGNKLSKSIFEIAEDIVANPGPAQFSFTPIAEKTINNVTGYESFGSTNDNHYVYHFIAESGERYISLWYYYPWQGTERTFREESIAKGIVSSFRLLR